jgi:hypothetical protein
MENLTTLKIKENTELSTIGKLIYHLFTKKQSQCILINVIGKTGTGKSNAAINIGIETAEEIVLKKGGKIEDYFNLTDISVMGASPLENTINKQNQKKYNIIIIDDAPTTVHFSNSIEENQKNLYTTVNEVFQAFKNTPTLVILTMPSILSPSAFLVNNVEEKPFCFQVEITQKMHEQGLSKGILTQLFDQIQDPDKKHYCFAANKQSITWAHVTFKQTPALILGQYEKKRTSAQRLMHEKAIKALINAQKGE